ncbi:MAG: DMT family transporter [Gammaproteobacteria bacterium]
MVAFAANSLLCRMALGQQLIDAASFTFVRIVAGAVTLGVITAPRWRESGLTPNWMAVAGLSCYMVFFSFAYLTLTAGTGALLLFGAVQLTMFAVAIRNGEKLSFPAWFGLLTAFAGLAYLVAPGVTAPDPIGAALMVIAGIGWGVYSLIGRGAGDPLRATASNFLYSVPFAAAVGAIFFGSVEFTAPGVLLAAVSGALASGMGYAIWYAALRGLKASQAATVQLSVPILAGIGGAMFLMEPFTLRLVMASILTLGGIWLVLARRSRRPAGAFQASRPGSRPTRRR